MRPLDLVVLGILLLLGILFSRFRRPKMGVAEAAKPAVKRSNLQAAQLLEEQGFEILEYQPGIPVNVWIDDRLYSDQYFGDLLVEKERIKYLVTVRSEKNVAKVGNNRNERFELLELYLLHGADGIIWVDLPRQRLHHITFELGMEAKSQGLKIPWCYMVSAGVGALLFWVTSLLITRGW